MTRVQKQKLTKINDNVSFIVGFIAFMVMACEVEDLRYWYIPFVGGAVLLAVVYVNRKVSKYIEQN